MTLITPKGWGKPQPEPAQVTLCVLYTVNHDKFAVTLKVPEDTGIDDIPGILAARYLGGPEAADRVDVLSIKEIRS